MYNVTKNALHFVGVFSRKKNGTQTPSKDIMHEIVFTHVLESVWYKSDQATRFFTLMLENYPKLESKLHSIHQS